MNTYHVNAYGLPKTSQYPSGIHTVYPTRHAIEAMQDDNIVPFGKVNFDNGTLIEASFNEYGNLIKSVWRFSYNRMNDIVFVVTSEYNIKTVWLNKKSDNHKTLDKTKYDMP